MTLEEIAIGIGTAALAGAVYGFVGYFKNKKQEDIFVEFDLKAFLTGVVGAAAMGGFAVVGGVTPEMTVFVGPIVFQTLRKAFKALLG